MRALGLLHSFFFTDYSAVSTSGFKSDNIHEGQWQGTNTVLHLRLVPTAEH